MNEFIHKSVIDIANLKGIKHSDSRRTLYCYLHYEVVIYKTNLTIGNAVALPEHLYNNSNEKNLIKFDNYYDNLCFLEMFSSILLKLWNNQAVK